MEKSLILHTDRGIQYVCREYVEATVGMKRSYSKKAYPWDNACIESFHALIKREWLNRFKIKNYDHAYKLHFTKRIGIFVSISSVFSLALSRTQNTVSIIMGSGEQSLRGLAFPGEW